MGFFGRERSSRGRDPGVPSRSSRKLRLDRDSDADVHLHPRSRQARLLKAQQGGSRRSGIAAHSSRNMSRAARAEEKIRLLDGIGGPGGATYSPPETATPSSLAKRARDAAPSFARVALLLALVAAVFVIAARPDIITAGRILAADALVRALAGRADAPVAARAREAVPEATVPGPRPRRGRRRASRDQPRTTPASSTHHPRDGPLAPFPERCVRLTADGVGLGAEMLSLVHAARHFRSEDKAVVWDYADGAATCGCAETSDEHVEKKKENVASSSNGSDRTVLSARGADAAAGMFRKLLRDDETSSNLFSTVRASVGESTSASGTCAEEEDDNGWFSMFSSDAVYPPAWERALVGGARADPTARSLGRKAGAPSPTSSSSCAVASASEVAAAVAAASRTSPSARSRLAAGSANVMCEEVSSTWRLAPAMRDAVDAAFEDIGGDATRTVAFHATRVTSDGLAYAPNVAKEVARVERMMRGVEARDSPARDSAADDSAARDSAADDSAARDSAARDSAADDSPAGDSPAGDSPSLSAKELRAVERANRERAREEAETKRAESSARRRAAAYIRSAMKDLRGDAREKKKEAKARETRTDETTSDEGATLMESFSSWLRARDDAERDGARKSAGGSTASLDTGRRLLRVITDDASGEGTSAATEAKASAALNAAEGVLTPPESSIAAEDASMLHRVREKFAGFERGLESREAEAAAAEARRVEKREHERAFDEALVAAKANVRARVASETVASLSGEGEGEEGGEAAWRCVVVGDDAELAAEIVSAVKDANLPCEVVNRVTERPRGADRSLVTLSPAERCRAAVDDVVAAEVLSGAERAVVAAPSDIGRLAALLQQCREDRLDMTDWAGLGVHELSVSAERGLPRAAAAAAAE